MKIQKAFIGVGHMYYYFAELRKIQPPTDKTMEKGEF